jgi:hypothetical protein
MSNLLVDGIVRGAVVAAVFVTFALAREYMPSLVSVIEPESSRQEQAL